MNHSNSTTSQYLVLLGFSGSEADGMLHKKRPASFMASLQQLSRQEALKYLESREVQKAFVEAFCSLYTKTERDEIFKSGFWKFAKKTCAAKQANETPNAKCTNEIHLLNDLFLALQGKHPIGDPRKGSLGGVTEYKTEFNFKTTRRHVRGKFRRHSSHLNRLDINMIDEGTAPHCVLVVYPSREVASRSHDRKGRPPKSRIDYPIDPVARRMENLRTRTPIILQRPEILKVVDDFMCQDQDLVLVLCGSCYSGKTAWMLEYQEGRSTSTVFYPFDRCDEGILSQKTLSRHLARKCAGWASTSKRQEVLDTLTTLEEVWANLPVLGAQWTSKPTVLFDAIEQAGPCQEAVLRFIHQCVKLKPSLLKFVLTLRTPSNLLPRLENLPKARVSRVFDSRNAVLEFMRSWCRAAEPTKPTPEKSLSSIYEQVGSNLQLAEARMSQLLQGKHA